MSSLKSHEKVILEKIFDKGGYVLDFSDRTYSEFFREHGVNIDQEKYRFNGTSKMKRLRAFWEIEEDNLVGKVLDALLIYACTVGEVKQEQQNGARTIVDQLLDKNEDIGKEVKTEKDFLKQEFKHVNLQKLNLDTQFFSIINQRIEEIQNSLDAQIPLATVFLCGSTLEGLLLDVATKNIERFNRSETAPKDKEGKIKKIQDWTLDNLINTSHEVGFLSLDIKKHSHSLKSFRNYIHPREQAVQNFKPDMHTAKISWQVLQAALADLTKER